MAPKTRASKRPAPTRSESTSQATATEVLPSALPLAPEPLTNEAVIEGIYQRMRRDGVLPSSSAASAAAVLATSDEPVTSAPTRQAQQSTQFAALAALLAGGPITSADHGRPGHLNPISTLSSPLLNNWQSTCRKDIWAGKAISLSHLFLRFDCYDSASDTDSEDAPSK